MAKIIVSAYHTPHPKKTRLGKSNNTKDVIVVVDQMVQQRQNIIKRNTEVKVGDVNVS